MTMVRRICWGVLGATICAGAHAQRPVPLADPVDQTLLPYGITDQNIRLAGELAYMFKDEGGHDVVHLVGDFSLKLGGPATGHEMHSREAVVWLVHRTQGGKPYLDLQIFLWRDAEVREIGRTVTSSPALFVTINTFGKVQTDADDLTFEAPSDSPVYLEGRAIRQAIAPGAAARLDRKVSLRVFDAAGLGEAPERTKPRPTILLQFPGEFHMAASNGQRVITVTGGAYMSRGEAGSTEYLEIRADAIAVFLPAGEDIPMRTPSGEPGMGPQSGIGSMKMAAGDTGIQHRKVGDRQQLSGVFGAVDVEAVYLEGDVVMSQGANKIQATSVYYDFADEQALILDASVHAKLAQRNVPLYLRAAEIRQVSARRFVAEDAILTTSAFHTPHYHIGARQVEFIDRTPPGPGGAREGIRAGSFRIQDATLNLGGTPVAYWPSVRGRVDTSETAIRSLRMGYSGDFGVELETDWHLFNVLDLETPEGFDATLSLDYFSERGPAVGVDVDYERDRYYGFIRSYLMTDDGEDSLGRERDDVSTEDVRGRVLLRHRQYLEDDWQVTLELSYISDRNFLQEFFENEFENGKEQETLLHLKKQRDNWAFAAILQGRLMDFTTVTERYPDLAYFRVGEPLGDHLTWYSESRMGIVRYRPATQTFRDLLRDGEKIGSGSVGRTDSRQEIDLPLDLGPVRFVPFATVRSSSWDDSPRDGGLTRGMAIGGVRGSMYLSKESKGMTSTMFDIDGLRHIIKSDIVAWAAAANVEPDRLFPFDDTVEGAEDASGVAIGLRQRWQTKRGEGENRRTVDFVTLDVEVGAFDDPSGQSITNGYTSYARPENSIARNYVNSSLIWRINDRTALLSEMNYDMNDGEVDVLNLSVAVERPPRLSYLLGYRFIEETHSNLLAFDMNYALSTKYTMAMRELFDFSRGETLDFTIAVIRKFPRWFGAVAFELDEAEDDFGVSFSVWPEGLSQAALGSKRFTGLAQTTKLKND